MGLAGVGAGVRVGLYGVKRLGGIARSGLLLNANGTNDGDSTAYDISGESNDLTMAQSNCITLNGTDQYGDTNKTISSSSGTVLMLVEAIDQGAYTNYASSSDTGIGGVSLIYHEVLKRPYLASTLGTSGTTPLGGWADGTMQWVAGIWSFDGTDTSIAVYLPDSEFFEETVYAGELTNSDKTVKIGARGDTAEAFDYAGGKIACFGLFGYALTTDQIDDIIAKGSGSCGANPIAEGAGLISYSTAIGGTDIDWHVGLGSSTVMWSGRQSRAHANAINGCTVYTHDLGTLGDIYVPYLSTGIPQVKTIADYTKAYDVDPIGGNRLMLPIETGFKAPEVAGLLPSGLLSADGLTMDTFYYDDVKAWVSGVDDTWAGVETDANGTCIVKGLAVYAESRGYTSSEYRQLNNALPNTCGAGVIVPVYLTDGVLSTIGNEVVFTLPD